MKKLKEENQEKLEQSGQVAQISAEVMEHMMSPRNYGVMDDANGIGMAVDKKTGEFTMMYIKIEDDIIKNISFGVNACQDTVVAGSLFTEMVKGDTLENGIKAMKLMDEKLFEVPKKQRVCSGMVLEAFRSSIRNYENRKKGMDEEMFTFDLQDSCEGINFE
jgi:nitrogen fixation NifU-like protein